MDMICEGLQAIVKQSGGAVSSYCQAGAEHGMTISRSAFSILVKCAGLHDAIQEIVDQIDIKATLGNIPAEQGPERNKAIMSEIQNVEKSNEIVK